jgi:nucleoside-diphosphate-sugar epimerase
MAMPDAIAAILQLGAVNRHHLSRTVYNIGAFNPSAAEIEAVVRKAFPKAEITTAVDEKRQGIVDSWPEDVDDSAARRDWGFMPNYDFEQAFQEYLIPTIRGRYSI